jgi:hypothetical protein
MSDYVRIRISPVDIALKEEHPARLFKQYEFDGRKYVINMNEVKTVPRVVAAAWTAFDADVVQVTDLGNY